PAVWAQTLQTVGVLLASELNKAGSPAILGPNTLVIGFPAAYNQAREFCQRATSVARIQDALRKLTGREWLLRIEAAPGSEPAPTRAEPSEASVPAARPRRSPREDAGKQPLVQRAVDVLGAQFV